MNYTTKKGVCYKSTIVEEQTLNTIKEMAKKRGIKTNIFFNILLNEYQQLIKNEEYRKDFWRGF